MIIKRCRWSYSPRDGEVVPCGKRAGHKGSHGFAGRFVAEGRVGVVTDPERSVVFVFGESA